MTKINIAKKAQSLNKKLIAERDKLQKNSEAIGKVLLTTETIIGGYKMVQKLRKQKSLFDSVVEVLNDRIKIFDSEISKNVAEK